jgi:hypothetical protein
MGSRLARVLRKLYDAWARPAEPGYPGTRPQLPRPLPPPRQEAPVPPTTSRYQAGDGPASSYLVSSASVTRIGNHDRVRIWNRGGLAGELTVVAGDGARIALGFGLEPRP